MLQKSIKWSLILVIVGGLSSCMMYEQRDERAPSPMAYEQQQHVMKQTKVVKASKAASSSAKEPMQKTTPGPKRAAAPQLPVIQ